ncbi:asparagine synthase (glutamine-hydrolyzing) [Arsukibacterium indicum]|uniref:asparagine synthase (glutamine-hydrolyzing) n=1 Tax=Arsukibacterium indicum TaxID=2848612 RepID=A0ABS6MHF2_9GAMM|nr:asparagine synthase (glutamine-hydrolyzing) [Arsukibacterium indicum]MBV2127804.1 asparagine synthase (glutamine-hydrolyzing) [Arsukibacterium indicum]
MCGFAGILAEQQTLAVRPDLLQAMGDSIVHRGPDDQGIYTSADNTIGLVHRRLAILDLSEAGHQPMASVEQRYVIAFNGEIYNHLTLRRELEQQFGSQWRGHSDTETLLEGIRCWGIEQTLQRCAGMFAFALWDTEQQRLTLARDRAGEKPLYYGFCNGVFLFGSELKALKQHPAFDNRISMPSVALMLRYKYIPAPHTVYQHIQKLPPGCILTLSGKDTCHTIEINTYWSFPDAAQRTSSNLFEGSDQEAVAALEAQLKLSVREQMLADVPLGAFLSGGTDSSLIAALMQAQSSKPVKTFTVGFHVPEYNEAEHAKAVATHLGTDHTEVYVDEQDALNVVPSLAHMYDEPLGDSSQIPTYLIAKEAKKHVTVALSGDGGDELFGGYSRYFRATKFARKLSAVPTPTFSLLKKCQPLFHADIWQDLDHAVGLQTKGTLSHSFARVAELAELSNFSGIYRHVVSNSKHPALLLKNVTEPENLLSHPHHISNVDEQFNWMMLADSQSYLPDDVLVKVDRAAMATSLETRVPMLDHRFIELALQMPLRHKVRDGQGKWALKQILYKHVPRGLLDRPKKGFGVPIDHWLRGPLKSWAEALLDESRLKQQGLFNVKLVRKYWREHLSGARDWQYLLWNLLTFQSWLEQQ